MARRQSGGAMVSQWSTNLVETKHYFIANELIERLLLVCCKNQEHGISKGWGHATSRPTPTMPPC